MEPVDTLLSKPEKPSFWKRLKRRRWWIAVGVVFLLIVFIVMNGRGGTDVEYVTAQVVRGSLTQTVEASGALASLTDVDLSFEGSGTVASIPVAIGDEVAEGGLLATLASSDVLAELSRAQESVNFAQANINQLLAGSTDEAIATAQAGYNAANIDYSNAVTSGEVSVETAAIYVDQSMDDLTQVRTDNDEDVVQTYEDLRSVLRESVIEIRSVLADADDILGREQKNANDDFENILAATDPQTINDANRTYDSAAEARDVAESAVYGLVSDSTVEEVIAVADVAQEALELTADALYDTRRVLDATFSNSTNLSKVDLDAFKTTIDAGRNTIQSEEASLLTQRQLIDTTQINADSTEEDALNTYENALQAYTKAQTDREASVASAEAALASRAADFANVAAQTRSVDLAPLQAQLGQALADLDATTARLSKKELRSPINGVVTSIEVDAGELAAAGAIVMTVQNTQIDAYKVTVQISESDIAKIEVDQRAEMTFDAFGDDVVVVGRVMSINPAEEAIEGVVFYEVDVTLDEGVAGMKPGMSVDVTIFTDQLDDVLYVPQRAVLERDDIPYVRILTNVGYEERTVEKGLRADGGFIEIISGLEEAEEVILTIRE